MPQVESADVVLQECRFLTHRRALDGVLPEAPSLVPPLSRVEFLDPSQHRTEFGYPVASSPSVLGELFRFLSTELARALREPDLREPLGSVSVESLQRESYVALLSDRLARAGAHGRWLRLDGVLWLHLARTVAGLLGNDVTVMSRVERKIPEDFARGARWFEDLLRLKGRDPAATAAVKSKVLRALLLRHDVVLSALATSDAAGAEPSARLHRALVQSRIAWTERPDGLYSFFDLREVFLLKDRGLAHDEFLAFWRLLRGVAEEAYRARASGRPSAAEAWFVDRFVTDELLEKAGRLQIADGTIEGEDEFPTRVAMLLCFQDEVVDYLGHHLDRFPWQKAIGKRIDLPRDVQKRLREPSALAPELPAMQAVLRELLLWDYLNALTGFVREVDVDGERRSVGGRPLRRGVPVLDLGSEAEIHPRAFHGTAVAVVVRGFETRAPDWLLRSSGEAGSGPDSVRLERLSAWEAERPETLVAGRRPAFKNYRFELVFEDPASGQVVLVRAVGLRPGKDEPLFEYLSMSPEAYRTFVDRVVEIERHQVRVRRAGDGPQTSSSMPRVDPGPRTEPARTSQESPRPLAEPVRSSSGSPRPPPPPPRPPERRLADAPRPRPTAPIASSNELSLPADLAFAFPGPDTASAIDGRFGLSAPQPSAGDTGAGNFDDLFADLLAQDERGSREDGPVAADADPDASIDDAFAAFLAELASSSDAPDNRRSLLGRIGPDLVGRIAAVDAPAAPAAQPTRPRGPHITRTDIPDLGAVFRDYATYAEAREGRPSFTFGRRYHDVLFDVHRYGDPGDGAPFDFEVAITSFLIDKLRSHFVPRSLTYEPIPEGVDIRALTPLELLEALSRVP